MEVIVPAAGLSTRFPNTKPKYLLYGYDGVMMLKRSLQPYIDDKDINVTVGILLEHDIKFNASEIIKNEFNGKVRVIVLPEVTKGPADTVMQIIEHANMDYNKELLVKDCDSFFTHNIHSPGNYVCTNQITNGSTLVEIANKSFVVHNKDNIVQHIIEKQIVSDTICVGGYKFDTISVFRDGFLNIQTSIDKEIYVSHIIEYCISTGHIFLTNSVDNYIDVGTLNEWLKYNDKPTIFCDIDGTLIEAQSKWGENSFGAPAVELERNVNTIKKYQHNGSSIIFTTSRPESAKEHTVNMLNKLGFKGYTLLMGLNISRRILINDYNSWNPYPMATAINIRRNSDNLDDFL